MKQRALARDVDSLQGCPVLYKSPESYVTLFRRNFDSGFKALRTGLMEALKRINKEDQS